ncbi:MAG: radical SAM protein, partial [bacterium]|nr:radical SAM protein [bacterium]
MSVLLIRPPEQLRKGLLQATNVTGVFPALGIAYLAAVLREASMEVSILDMEAEEITLNRNLEKRLLSLSPTLIGITSTTLVWPAAAAIARFVKKVLPDVFVVAGGPQPTIYPRECLVCRAIDAVCIGEGERTIIDLAEVVSKGKKLEEVNGIAFIKKSRVLVTPAREPIEDLDSLPLPAVDLLPVAKYHALTVQTPFMTMVTSRGCPYRCKFCSQVYVGGTFRQRSAADVLSEFKRNIKELHVKEIVIFDETFTVDKDRLIQICKGIQTAGWNIRWTLRGRLDNVDREVVNWLKKAGCYGVHMGVESGEQYVLDLMKK